MVLIRPLAVPETSTFRLRVRDSSGETTTVEARVKATSGSSRDEETFAGVTDNVIKVDEVRYVR